MEAKEVKHVLAKRLFSSTQKTKSGSTFIGYAQKAMTVKDVVDGYKQLKYRYMDATHIMCAYRLMDPDVAHMIDCIDGGELGAGRRLVDMLIENSAENMVVYVVRFHRGPNIGAIRFQLIT